MSTPSNALRLRTLVVFAIVVACVAVLARGFTIWTLRADAIDDASRDVGHVATMLAEQTAQSIKAIDEPLAGLQQQLMALQEASPDDFQAAIRSTQMREALNDRLHAFRRLPLS